jgi:alkanesulfonate monooxygenase SsuD/methylene tetrahydromethanopterin reductase-like flavin-dependent oxidoreductase (luciferase family)
MRFSIAVPLQRIIDGQYRYDLPSFIAECQAAEKAGFHTAVVGERRIGVTAYNTSPHLLAAVALAKTTRLAFSIMVVQLPLRDPIQVIQDATVLNSLFPGRFRLGVGAGYNEHAFEFFGKDLKDRGRAMDSGLERINAFRNGEISIDVGRGPVPALDPAMGEHRPEVWVGAWAKAGVRRTARLADGWLPDPMRTGAVIAELADLYRAECAKHDKTPRIGILREAWLADTDEEARNEYGPAVLQSHAEYFPRMQGGWKSEKGGEGKPYDVNVDPWLKKLDAKEQLSLDDLLEDRFLVGSVDTWIENLDRWIETIQPEEFVLRFRFQGGPDPAATLKVIERVGRDIIPRYS